MENQNLISTTNEKWHSTLKLPSQENVIFLDIETDPGHRLWLIGVLYEYQLHQFIAKDQNEEQMILLQFQNFLENNPNVPMICYSGTYFDFRIVINRAKHFGLDLIKSLSNRMWIDMCIELKKVYTPRDTYQLKDLAKRYHYPLIHNMDGRTLSLLYDDRIKEYRQLDENFINIALEYNADDILLLPFLITKFETNVVENNHIEFVSAEQIVKWVFDHSKLIHKKSNSVTIYLGRGLQQESLKYLSQICIPPKINKSKYHISYTWENFAMDIVNSFLSNNL